MLNPVVFLALSALWLLQETRKHFFGYIVTSIISYSINLNLQGDPKKTGPKSNYSKYTGPVFFLGHPV